MLNHVEFDLAREGGDGAVLSVDLHGYHDLDDVERIFADIVRDEELDDEFGVLGCPADEREPEETDGGTLLVEHCYRIDVPVLPDESDDGEAFTEWRYLTLDGAVGRTDGIIVTKLERLYVWRNRMCWAHPFEPATAALPIGQHPDYDRWAHEGNLHCCNACATQLHTESETFMAAHMGHHATLKARGLRDTFTGCGVLPSRLWEKTR